MLVLHISYWLLSSIYTLWTDAFICNTMEPLGLRQAFSASGSKLSSDRSSYHPFTLPDAASQAIMSGSW